MARSVPLALVTTSGCSLQVKKGLSTSWGPPGNALGGKGACNSRDGNKSSTRNGNSEESKYITGRELGRRKMECSKGGKSMAISLIKASTKGVVERGIGSRGEKDQKMVATGVVVKY